jgi:hypothetical protein
MSVPEPRADKTSAVIVTAGMHEILALGRPIDCKNKQETFNLHSLYFILNNCLQFHASIQMVPVLGPCVKLRLKKYSKSPYLFPFTNITGSGLVIGFVNQL